MAGMGDSVANKLDGFSRINDQRMEILRTAIDQRLDSFTVETARKVDSLTQSVGSLISSLQDVLATRLVEFKSLLDGLAAQSQNLQTQHTETISSTIRSL